MDWIIQNSSPDKFADPVDCNADGKMTSTVAQGEGVIHMQTSVA